MFAKMLHAQAGADESLEDAGDRPKALIGAGLLGEWDADIADVSLRPAGAGRAVAEEINPGIGQGLGLVIEQLGKGVAVEHRDIPAGF